MAVCIKCGFPPVPGFRYCAECAPSTNPPAVREFDPPACSEELCAACMGRFARIEDEVRALRARINGHDGQLVELLREIAKEKTA